MNNTSYQVWVYQQEEPSVLITGNAKRYTHITAQQEKNRLLDKEIEDIKKKLQKNQQGK